MQDETEIVASPDTLDLTTLVRFGEGRTAEVYLYDRVYVIKVFRPGFPVQAIDNEYLVCRSIGELITIPRARQRLMIAGRHAIVFDRVRGSSGFRYIVQRPWKVRWLAREFASMHVAIHSTSIPDEVPELPTILARNINLHERISAAAKSRILEYLNLLPGGNSLCHGDFHPENIIVTGGTPCVLDWMTATRGNPLADVARTSLLLKWAEPGPGTPVVIRVLLGVIRRIFHRTYMNEYLRLTGADLHRIEQWELPVMAARLLEWLPESEKKVLEEKIEISLSRLGTENPAR